MKRYRILVRGRVQGVFFRVSTKKEADRLDISGWVKNEPDGAVLIEAEGNESEIKSLIEWCNEGSPSARVDTVQVDEIPRQGSPGFQIVH